MKATTSNLPNFPCLPLISLDDSAEELTTHDVVKGKNTVIGRKTSCCSFDMRHLHTRPHTHSLIISILFCHSSSTDFWTTRCTRCPAALDQLNGNTQLIDDKKNNNVQLVSICCGDKLDGARHILDQDEERRWTNMQHYFMNYHDKERAKKILGFRSVPFYVVLNDQGEIVQLGNKIDWDHDSIMMMMMIPSSGATTCGNGDKENEDFVQVPKQEDRVFELDDLDF